MFRHAIVRPPGRNFEDGLTSAGLGKPAYEKALEQHRSYCEALRRCGLTLIELDTDPEFPDSTFVEDTAILCERCAIVTRPGAASRSGEVVTIKKTLAGFYSCICEITSPGSLDGGDVCQADHHFFIGISMRTNEEGARQLAKLLEQEGFTATCVDIRKTRGILHLKSGIAYLGENRLIVIDALAGQPELDGYESICVRPEENYAANCVRINDYVLIAAGYPRLAATLRSLGYSAIPLELSEFRKMDGGLSCLSLRF